MEAPDQQELVRRARDGDTQARHELFERFEGSLKRYLQRRVGPKLARAVSLSDLCQDTFVQALEALRVLPDDATYEDFHALLYQHAGWTIGKQAEKHGRFHGESVLGDGQAVPEAEAGSSGDVTRLDELDWLMRLVDRLPENQRAVVRMRLDGASYEDIARELGLAERAVRQRYVRGSRELKRLVDARGEAG